MLLMQYLMEQKLVKAEQIVEALVEQVRSLPSSVEVVFELKLLTHEALFNILAEQQISGTDFQKSANKLGFWSDELRDRIHLELSNRRRPLVQILVQLGYLSLQNLPPVLNGYVELANRVSPSVRSEAAEKSVAAKPLTEDSQYSEPRPMAMLDSFLISEYAEALDTKFIPSMKNLLVLLQGKSRDKEAMASAIKFGLMESVMIRAAANFLGAIESEKLADSLVKVFDRESILSGSVDESSLLILIETGLSMLNCLCLHMKNNRCEFDMSKDSEWIERRDRFWKAWNFVQVAKPERAA